MSGPETPPPTHNFHPSRRQLLTAIGVGALLTTGLVGCSLKPDSNPQLTDNEHSTIGRAAEIASPTELLTLTGQSLIDMRDETKDGWRYQSSIQSPHFQTDRDVGASGIGMGFLVLADQFPQDQKWVSAAKSTASWLASVAKRDANGNPYWPDFADDNEVSESYYTSFDDGTLGIGDFFWNLYEKTKDPQYKAVAIGSLQWTFDQAKNVGDDVTPVYRWKWDANDPDSPVNMGMGMGAVGLVHTFSLFYERLQTSDPMLAKLCKKHIDGTLRYIDITRAKLGNNDGDSRAIPETGVIGQDGDTTMNSGYLSGAAGAAFMYLKLYKTFGDKTYLQKADELFSWLEDKDNGPMVKNADQTAWKLTLDPQGGDDSQLATGFEEGAAGIGWVYLQAYKVTGKQHYLDIARSAGNWLGAVAVKDQNGYSWHEDEAPQNPIIHANLNNGAAGVGMFLKELAETTNDKRYEVGAKEALQWIQNMARKDGSVIFWNDNDGEQNYSKDPSWHWGTAGIVAFISRMEGGKINMPGHQEGL